MDKDNRKRKEPEDTSTFDWRAGVPRSIRLENRFRIAQARQHLSTENDPMAINDAYGVEQYFLNNATNEFDYLMRIDQYLQGERDADPHHADLSMIPPLQNSNSPRGIVGPNEDPSAMSRKRKGKQPLAIESRNSPMNLLATPTKTIAYLVERHSKITLILQNLVLLFPKLLELGGTQQDVSVGGSALTTADPMTRMQEQSQQQFRGQESILQQTTNLHIQIAKGEFLYGLEELARLLTTMVDMVEYGDKIDLIEELYEEKILQLLGTFIMRINWRLEELSSDDLHAYQQWALSIRYDDTMRYRSDYLAAQSPLTVFRAIGPSTALMEALFLNGYLAAKVRQMRVQMFRPDPNYLRAQRTSERGLSQQQSLGVVGAADPNQQTVAPIPQPPQIRILPDNSGNIQPPQHQLHLLLSSHLATVDPNQQTVASIQQQQPQIGILPGDSGIIRPSDHQLHQQQLPSHLAAVDPSHQTIAPPQIGFLPGNIGPIQPPLEHQLHQQQLGVPDQENFQPIQQTLEQPQQQPQAGVLPGDNNDVLPAAQQPGQQHQGSSAADISDDFCERLNRFD